MGKYRRASTIRTPLALQKREKRQKQLDRRVMDPNSDVILRPKCHIEIQTSAAILRSGSPVFEAMFRPNVFAEGTPSTSGKVVVDLPDDNMEAMVQICALLHHRDDQINRHPSFSCLEDLAILVDKYDIVQTPVLDHCQECLVPFIYESEGRSTYRVQCLALAILFNDSWAFKEVTTSMIYMNHASEDNGRVDFEDYGIARYMEPFIPKHIFETLQHCEHFIKSSINLSIKLLIRILGPEYRYRCRHHPKTLDFRKLLFSERDRVQDALTWRCECENIETFLNEVRKAGLWPRENEAFEKGLGYRTVAVTLTKLRDLEPQMAPDGHDYLTLSRRWIDALNRASWLGLPLTRVRHDTKAFWQEGGPSRHMALGDFTDDHLERDVPHAMMMSEGDAECNLEWLAGQVEKLNASIRQRKVFPGRANWVEMPLRENRMLFSNSLLGKSLVW